METVSSVDIDRNWTLRQLIDHLVENTNWLRYQDTTMVIDDEVEFVIYVKVIKKEYAEA
jgi:hypothetical protein